MQARAEKPQRSAAAPGKQARMPKKKNIKEKLHDLPQAAGMAIMALLLVISLFVGNFRALDRATPKDFIRQGDVMSIVEDRIDAAENVMSIAKRTGLDEGLIAEAKSAMERLEKAKTAREISRANQALSAAVSELTAKELDLQDAEYMRRAADDFAEMGSFLRQEAKAYNEKAKKAEKLYERLPTKFMLPEVDIYEGI